MNTLGATFIQSPNEKEEECALFKIENTEIPFVMHDVTSIGKEYTLTFWIKSDYTGSLLFKNKNIDVTTEWLEHVITFEADSVDVSFTFQIAGNYYMYHPQIEIGNKSTDWSPAPEDASDDISTLADTIDNTNAVMQKVSESMSELSIKADNISSTVRSVEQIYDELSGEYKTTKDEFSKFVQDSSGFYATVTSIVDDGVTKVNTTTGTFDKNGLTIDNNDSPTKTTVTPDGMTVYKKTLDGENENLSEVLTATSEGVHATNLHADTFLIVNNNSRFETYKSNRTGCFWIGG